MIIAPTNYRLFRVIEKGKGDKTKAFFYDERGQLICSGEFDNLSPEGFDELKKFLDYLILINNSKQTPFVIGVIELQNLLKKWSE